MASFKSTGIFINLVVKKYCVKLNQNEKLREYWYIREYSHVSHLTFFY